MDRLERPPIVTFHFPKQVGINKKISLILHLQNPDENKGVIVTVLVNKHDDLIWLAKTKHICAIKPLVSRFPSS